MGREDVNFWEMEWYQSPSGGVSAHCKSYAQQLYANKNIEPHNMIGKFCEACWRNFRNFLHCSEEMEIEIWNFTEINSALDNSYNGL